MNIEPKLKPLYANLKRLEIGEYLNSKEFELFAIENNIDEVWEECKKEVRRSSNVVVIGHHDTEDDEEAFGKLMTLWYDQDYDNFDNFITTILINFSKWHPTKLNFKAIHNSLKQIGLTDKKVLNFTKEIRKIRDTKPEEIEESKLNSERIPQLKYDSKKVFIVHGHDLAAKLELSKILKDDLGLEPVVLQEEANTSLETIISKFERLAKDCSSALILFTPDDEFNGKSRARQNVVLELGYFLGKFQDQKNRRIAIIKKGEVEIPSDISGVLYLEYSRNIKEIFYDLKKQFETWGIIK